MTAIRRLNLDWPLIATAATLTAFGILMVYSAGQTDVRSGAAGAYRAQLVWFAVAVAGAYALSRSSVRLIDWLTVPLYSFAILLLVVVLLPGFGSGAGTAASVKGWLTIGGKRLGQPAEFAKLAVVLMLAKSLSQMRTAPRSILELWKPIAITLVPLGLIMAQPDLGSAIVFVGIFFAMLFWAGISWPLLLLLASPVVSMILAFDPWWWGVWFLFLLGLVIWYKPFLSEGVLVVVGNIMMGVLSPMLWESALDRYQQDRLLTFIDPTVDPRGAGYHVTQSQIAIGSGGWLGRGFTEGPQKRLAFVPEQHTDFIFAVVGEELGFLGVMVALLLFLLLFVRIVKIAERANDAFGSLIAFGLLASWFTHVFENVGMTLNLMPITGIPLPFFSYGGSFLLASWLAVGILSRISSEGRGSTTQRRRY